MTSTTRTVAVVGPGAIGTTVAAALHEAGRTPRICGRTAREHLEWHAADARVRVPGPVRTDPARAGDPVDLIFLAVKSTQNEAAAPWLTALCRTGTVVCVLQNGVEQNSIAVPAGARLIPSVVWFPAQAQPDGSVWLRGATRLSLPDTPAAEVAREALRGTRCEVVVEADFTTVAWRKLLQNAVAGLMVLAGRRAGMFTRADVAGLALAYLREGLAVARAEGAALDDGVPQRIVEQFGSYPPDLGTSILTDREAGRPLEWDTRNGVLLRRGRAHGIPTPISELVVPLLAAASEGPG
ncbi:oxidoreductase [Amycolatopsis sp. PS_44_ISF1]|uniref:oxidoreductase n=1 Tax=Amycolatopsis sp. PS_44_ISF1 TaxID=2974917 RepID=UPI0028DE6403|nr:oxidoreductase [Amycolatopsis sp. PS_44_ISF1]MDT8913159.1 oxidoreductase [Amycolatopsis sp. PS_44_ISF1]